MIILCIFILLRYLFFKYEPFLARIDPDTIVLYVYIKEEGILHRKYYKLFSIGYILPMGDKNFEDE